MSGGGQSVPKKLETILGTAKFFDNERDGTPGVLQTIFDELVPALKKWRLHSFKADSTTYGVFRIFKVTDPGESETLDLIGSGQTGPGGDPQFIWHPGRDIPAGCKVRVTYQAFAGCPITPIRTHLALSEINVP